MNELTYRKNYYSRSIHCKATVILVILAYNFCENLNCERIHMSQQEKFLLNLPWGCKAQPHCALLGYPFHNMAAHMEATPTREGI